MIYISQENEKRRWVEICLVLAILVALAGIGIIFAGGAHSERKDG